MRYMDDSIRDSNGKTDIHINRQSFTVAGFNERFEYHPKQVPTCAKSFRKATAKCCSSTNLIKRILRFFPFIGIMRNYNWKRSLVKDLIAGATISAMHIPQGMAYGQLASLRPIHGLYISFFPVILYFIFGTSRHTSIGSFAVISLMVAKVLETEMSSGFFHSSILRNSTDNISTILNSTEEMENLDLERRLDLAVSLNLITGIMQIILGFFGAGFITKYLSDPFISGYTTGCACQVFTSQLKYVFGISIKRHNGAFKIYETWRDVILNIEMTNFVTLGLSACAAVFLLVCKLVLDPFVKKRVPMPIPSELVLMIISVVASYFLDLGPDHNVRVVGPVPSNLPMPRLPPYIRTRLIIDAIPLVLVSYSLAVSMGKLFAKQYRYKIDSNQEWYAIGISNAVSSFFDCYTSSASMSRSLVQANVGGQTQLAGLVSCVVILNVILFLGVLLKPLPVCILAVVVMVNLRGMFLQVYDLLKYWRSCKLDAVTWLVAFIATVLIDVDIGLYIGVAFVVLTVVIHSAK